MQLVRVREAHSWSFSEATRRTSAVLCRVCSSPSCSVILLLHDPFYVAHYSKPRELSSIAFEEVPISPSVTPSGFAARPGDSLRASTTCRTRTLPRYTGAARQRAAASSQKYFTGRLRSTVRFAGFWRAFKFPLRLLVGIHHWIRRPAVAAFGEEVFQGLVRLPAESGSSTESIQNRPTAWR